MTTLPSPTHATEEPTLRMTMQSLLDECYRYYRENSSERDSELFQILVRYGMYPKFTVCKRVEFDITATLEYEVTITETDDEWNGFQLTRRLESVVQDALECFSVSSNDREVHDAQFLHVDVSVNAEVEDE
jgi:hypothetical protein